MPFVEPGFVDSGFVEGDPLSSLFFDPETLINVAVEIDSIHRTTGAVVTWYFALQVDEKLRSAHPTFMPYLRGPLSFAQSLTEDNQFSGLVELTGSTITILQPIPDSDRLSQLNDYSFAGRKVTVRVGRFNLDEYGDWAVYRTLTIARDPAYSLLDAGVQFTFPVESTLSRTISTVVDPKRHVGLPTCLRFLDSTGKVTVPHIAAYDLDRFTVAVRFRIASTPSNQIGLVQKFDTVGGNKNFRIAMNTDGTLLADLTAGITGFQLNAATDYTDADFHIAVFSVNSIITAYLMVDSIVTDEGSPVSAPVMPSVGLEFFTRAGGGTDIDGCYIVIIDRYMTPDEARAMFSVALVGDEPGIVGYWPMTDNTGSAVADLSTNNNDGAIAGVENINFSWFPSDLGEPELAGQSQSLFLGTPVNYQLTLIDKFRQRYRLSDSDIVGVDNRGVFNIKSRGTALSLIADWNFSTLSVIQMVAQEDEPVTCTVTMGGALDQRDNTIMKVASNIVAQYTTPTFAIDTLFRDSMIDLVPWIVGYHTNQSTDLARLLKAILGDSGAYYSEDNFGNFTPGFLLPPLGLSVYSEPILDFRGVLAGLQFSNIANTSGSRTLGFWMITYASDQSSGYERKYHLVSKLGSYDVYYYSAGANVGRFHVKFGNTSSFAFDSPGGLIKDGIKTFIAFSFDNSAHTCAMYVYPEGGPLDRVYTLTGIGAVNDSALNNLTIGSGLWGSITHVQLWNSGLTLAQIQSVIDNSLDGSESGLLLYVPITEGANSRITDLISGTWATADSRMRWCPVLTVNLNSAPSVKIAPDTFRHLNPVQLVTVKYAHNNKVMGDGDIDTGVSQSVRLDLSREWKDLPLPNDSNLDVFARARPLTVFSSLINKDDAQRLARMLAVRYGTDRFILTLDGPSAGPSMPTGHPVSRRMLALGLGDEVRVVSAIPSQLAAGRSFRVVGSTLDPVQLAAQVVLWG